MTACNLRSLLVAAIVLSNCITWTASRHHFTHNVHGHRSRHRRQGAGLYLSASYITPGGEGEGWGEWGDISPCSRTCGGGVAHQKRICLAIGPDGQPQCRGGDTKYFSCETQDCPSDAKDFRAEQCADFNDKDFRGAKYNWVPYTKAVNPCELNCMPHAERFYYRHKPKVIDGTRCTEDSYDVCVDGICQMVGCDMMLGSNAREDKCRECRGNGSNCVTTAGLLDSQDLVKGYNDILLIPAGSTTIVIEEIAPSNNYLALRNKNGTYYLNGHYHIDFPKSTTIAGALWNYERSQSSYPAPDKLRCMGPTIEPLYLSLLLQDENVGIQYEYSLPKDIAPYTDKQYHWVHEEFSPCNTSCGGGFQSRNVTCRLRENLDIVDDGLCDEGLKPVTNQTCNTDPCPAEWVEGLWSECSKHCGKDGVRNRTVTCEKIIVNGIPSLVAEKECFDLHGLKPELYQECNRDAKCPTWFIGHWKACDKLCDEGKQTRQVVCHLKQNGRIKIFEDSECEGEKPATEKPCMLSLCDGVDWITTEWNGCDTCVSKVRTREALCATKDYNVYNDSFCDYHHRPIIEEPCEDVPPCEYQWYASQWSKCSVECGEGVRIRKVFCGLYINNEVQEVEDAKCGDQPKYNDTKPCVIPDEKCPSQWYTAPWTECTEKCGGGDQYRRVMCMRGKEHATDCLALTVPSATESCNTHACNADDLIPVDPLSSPIIDENCTDEDYSEVGLDEITGIKLSTMLGADLSTADTESEFDTTDESSTFEDSTTPLIDYDYTDTSSSIDTAELGSGQTYTSDETTTDETTSSSDTESTNTDNANTNATISTEPITKDSTSNTESTISEKTDLTMTSGYSSASSDGSSTPTEDSIYTTENTDEGLSSGTESTVKDKTDSSTTSKSDASTTDNSSAATGSTDAEVSSSTDKSDTTAISDSIGTEYTKSTEIGTTDSTSSGSDDTTSSNETTDGETTTASSIGSSSTSVESSESTVVTTTSPTSSTSGSESTSTESNAASSKSSSESTSSETSSSGSSTSESVSTSPESSTSGSESTSPASSTSSSESMSTESSISSSEFSSPESSTSVSELTLSETSSLGSSTSESVSTSPESSISGSESTSPESTSLGSESTSPASSTSSSESTAPKSSTSELDSTSPASSTLGSESSSTESGISSSEFSSPESSTSVSELTSSETSFSGSSTSESVSTSPASSTLGSESTSTESSISSSEFSSPGSSTSASELTSSETSSLGSSTSESVSTSPESSTSGSESTSPASSTSSSESTASKSSTSESDSTSPASSTLGSESTSTEYSISSSELTSSETSSSGSSTSESLSTSSEFTTRESISSSSTEFSSSGSESTSPEATTSVSESSSPVPSTLGSESTSPESSTLGSESTPTGSTTTRLEITSPESSTSESESTSPGSSTSGSESTSPESSTLGSESTSPESSTSESESTSPESTTSGSETTSPESSTTGSASTSLEPSTPGSESTLPGSSTSGLESTSSESSTSESESTSPESTTLGSETTSPESSTTGSASTSLEPSTTELGSTTPESSTVELESTVETTETTSSGSSLKTESTSISTGSSESEPTETTESSKTTGIEASTSTSESSTTGAGGSSTEGTPYSSTDGSTERAATTPWTLITIVNGEGVCKPRKRNCNKTKFGCCPDKKTAAAGPFDDGCPKPRTCKESLFGCCPDGVSAAQGDNEEGCPVTPCEETLFGCCQSDNKTAALGNDDEGCPAPCTVSKFGCCADEETEASGENGEGCPEYQSTTEETTSEGPSTSGSSTSEGSTSEGSTSEGSTSEGSTSEGSTTEGSTSEGSTSESTSEGISSSTESSTLPEGCVGSKFGCCYDNDTEASGPDMQGCPCTATEFGCCPDGVSSAQGKNNKGCQGACRNSKYGCCSDDQTPAHGPDFEGCCLLTAFGCCPDNRKAAEGPHLEGCLCQNAQYGCCPDNVTAARGPNNEGCGCQYTEFGCCLDRHTVASGPNLEGCSCLTYQFGCCPDGVTIATSPDQQSCRCEYSTYGCCGDAKTPATGPNGAGCDCSTSKYGCCPDGQTEAAGSQFLGCANVPENKQAVCSLSSDPGPCSNYTVVYFYDRTFGGCSRFWYGGCEGNGNKFTTKEDCEDICVRPAPKDVCKLPDVKGPCDEDHVRWYYNSTREQCLPFRYGGCLGNENNFDSRVLCQSKCETDKTTDTCNLPIEQGPCAGNFSRWGYSSESQTCEQFIWGGCAGNTNQFKTEAACQLRCGTHNVVCSEQQEAGNCGNKVALWSFSQTENRCVPFYYNGCGGNGNRFESRESCEQFCPSVYVPDKCTLPAETGDCSEYRAKWFYDTRIQRCRQFYYGGCGGNKNNFDTENECSNACTEPVTTTTTSTTIRPTQPQPQTEPLPQPEPEPDRESFCFLEIDAGGLCSFAPVATRYAYNSTLGKCVTFQHNGCGGNQNNFPNEELCTNYCHPVQDICQLPMMTGTCEDSLMSWFYDPVDDSCSQFTYSGCGGNGNRFESREACESRCGTGPAVAPATQKPTIPVNTTTTVAVDNRFSEQIPPECKASTFLEECRSAGEVWYFNPREYECVSHVNQERGRSCRYTATFQSQEACERHCGAFQEIDVCKQRLDPGPCQDFVTKVYFDSDSNTCKEFAYSGCLGGANRFSSITECSQVCGAKITTPDLCSLVPDQGSCGSYIEQWYYDADHGDCSQFVYKGCGGNDNRFDTRKDCESRCKLAVTTTTTVAPVVHPEEQHECKTPSSLAPCGYNITVFYYDSNSKSCLPSEFGGCRHLNSYRSEEECERQCGAFRGEVDVCQAQLDPGPCRNPVMKYYFDSLTGRCQPFTYGGCAGGPNRFSTINECEQICGESGPGKNEVGCESYERLCASLTCDEIVRSSAPGGCESCACADTTSQCQELNEECQRISCPYGVRKLQENGCERCICDEDPCLKNNCTEYQRCVALALADPVTREPRYSYRCEEQEAPPVVYPPPEPEMTAVEGGTVTLRCLVHSNPPPRITWRKGEITIDGNVGRYLVTSEGALQIASLHHNDTGVYICIADNGLGIATQQITLVVAGDETNEVTPDCSRYEAECARLNCVTGIEHMQTADGCQRCQCTPLRVDCEPYKTECNRVKCDYGMEKAVGPDGCERCSCVDPCSPSLVSCNVDERCVVVAYRDPLAEGSRYSPECRAVIKPGLCPTDDVFSNEILCNDECNDDAACRGIGKCCMRGCKKTCVEPAASTLAPTILTTTHTPDVPAAPKALPQLEPNLAVAEGGKATLRCLFHSNPPPRITWRRGEITINGNAGRYRLTSDGALEIVSLFRNDTGVYICVADNGLGTAKQEINLIVTDPKETPVGIAGDENAVITGELDKPLVVRCLAYGYPVPDVFWTRDKYMVPFNDAVYEIRGNSLLIRSLSVDTLGLYTCQAYNGIGKAASWVVLVRAYRPEGFFIEHDYLVARNSITTTRGIPLPTTLETTSTSTTTTTTERTVFFTVPVSVHVATTYSTLNIGAELRLACEVDGFPEPTVYWTKDGQRLVPDERTSITGNTISRLAISRVTVSDSGSYGCHADNGYSSHSDNAQINIQQLTVPAKCTDNPFFANCGLIVRSKFCNHKYYSKFCCKSCVEAGQLDPQVAEAQADQPYRKK